MKFKSVLLLLAFFMITALWISPNNVEAQDRGGWATCTIDRVGQGIGVGYIWLTRAGYWSEVRFKLNPVHNRELLATALTAISVGKEVRVFITDDPSSSFQQVNNIYVID